MSMMDEKHAWPNSLGPLIWKGVKQALPILLGYLPIGFAYGVLAQKAGISIFNTILMSIVVFAGSAQLIAVELFAMGLTPTSILLTTFVVNLRHMLMSAALSPHLGGWSRVELSAFAYELTDETFALHATHMRENQVDKAETFAINLTAQAAWVLGTGLGVVIGQNITEIEPFALDYALPAMFMALLVMQIKGRKDVIVAAFGGVLSVGMLLIGFAGWHVIIATVIAATLGVGMEQWTKKSSS
jgi:4-azaleucine resistance transporter AzlC